MYFLWKAYQASYHLPNFQNFTLSLSWKVVCCIHVIYGYCAVLYHRLLSQTWQWDLSYILCLFYSFMIIHGIESALHISVTNWLCLVWCHFMFEIYPRCKQIIWTFMFKSPAVTSWWHEVLHLNTKSMVLFMTQKSMDLRMLITSLTLILTMLWRLSILMCRYYLTICLIT